MREIKFRVKQTAIGKWWTCNLHSLYRMKKMEYDAYDWKTVCQYTGLKDKNGKEIFEGDIIDFGGLTPIEIVWRNSGFESRLLPFKDSNPISLTQEGMTTFAEIIGDIYENKELIK